MKSHDQSSYCPVIQKGDGNRESNTNSGCPDAPSHPIVMSDLFKLYPVVIDQEENPDHGGWDTGVM